MWVPVCAPISRCETSADAPAAMARTRAMVTAGSVGQCTMSVRSGTETSIHSFAITLALSCDPSCAGASSN